METLWGEMTVFQGHLCNDPYWGIFFSQPHTQPCCFHPLGVYTNPPPPVPPFLLTLNQSPKEIAGSDITNCLTHTMNAKAFKVACELCRHWRIELILSRAKTYHVFLNTILFILSLLRVVLTHSETASGISSCGGTNNYVFVPQVKMIHRTYMTVVVWCQFI